MKCQRILDRSEFLHQPVHLVFIHISQSVTDLIHLCFQIKQIRKRRFQHISDRHPFFQNRMLIQIADAHIFRPLDPALIGS